MKASVVVPTFERPGTLDRTLVAVREQTIDDYDVIVVDDGSESAEQESVLERHDTSDRVTVLRQANQGPAAARNRGWRASSAEFVLFTDDDCEPPSDWVESLVDGFDETVVGVGGPLVPPANISETNPIVRYTRYRDRVEYGEPSERVVGFEGLAVSGTANVAYRRSVLEEVDGFDESFPIAGGEDADLERRIRERGYRLVFVPVPVVHHDDYDWRSFIDRAYRGGVGTHHFHAKHGEYRSGPRVLAGLVGSPAMFVPSLLRSRSPTIAALSVLERVVQRLGELQAILNQRPS